MSRKDQVAQLMSEGLTTAQIRQRLSMTNSAVQGCVHRIKKDLGWQAQ